MVKGAELFAPDGHFEAGLASTFQSLYWPPILLFPLLINFHQDLGPEWAALKLSVFEGPPHLD